MLNVADFRMLSLVPAIVTIAVAMLWRRVSVAMACGVVSAALLTGHLHPGASAKNLGVLLWAALADVERLKIVVFILLVGGLIEMIAGSGAYNALADAIAPRLSTARRARLAIWGLSCCLFFDDYANVLISGSSMKSIARRRGIRPAMLAYTVDVVAVLASVMLVSTWAAFEQGTMLDSARAVGSTQSPGSLFLTSLPYHFYTYLAVLLALAVSISGRWFGAALDTAAIEDSATEEPATSARPRHVVAPFAALVVLAVAGVFASGAWQVRMHGEEMSLFALLSRALAIDSLIGATLVATLLAVVLLRRDRVIPSPTMRAGYRKGVRGMVEIGIIILLAKSLAEATIALGTGAYLAATFTRVLTPGMLPAAMFVLAMLVTVATGFSWGSMAIVMPVAYSFLPAYGAGLMPVLSAAVITGAVSGEHMIPYSEKAVLSAAACGISAVYHFKTQVLQTLAAFAAAVVGFLLLGFGWPLWICYSASAALLLVAHALLARKSGAESRHMAAVGK